MKREDQLYNAMVIFADLIGERVAAHMRGTGPMCPHEEWVLTTDEAAEIFSEWQQNNDLTEVASGSRRKLIPVTEWSKHHDFPKLGTIRNLIFHEESNGFDKVVRRIGWRVLIDEAAFFEWVDEKNAQKIK